jgi:RNA polymerase sigma-70 factor (ECF subfamily)
MPGVSIPKMNSFPGPKGVGNVVPLPIPESEVALVVALRERRPHARHVLVTRYGGDVERVIYRILGPDPEIDDLLQDVFLVALAALHRLRRPERLRSWLVGIAVKKSRQLIRQRRRWRIVKSVPPSELPERAATTPSQEVSEALRATYRILKTLPVDERIAFALRHVDGMELSDVAEATNVSLSTVKRRLSRAHARFVEAAENDAALADWLHPRSFLR